MDKVILEATIKLELPSLLKWKEAGGKIIGYTCSFLPVELFHAAGILPMRLRGIHATSMEIADAYYGPFVCSFPKAVLQLAGTGTYEFLDGVVITNGCDSMRRLDECWRKMSQDISGTAPDWFHYLDVPHKACDHTFDWYENQIRSTIAAVEDQFSVTITQEKLAQAIQEQNKIRRQLWTLEKLRQKKPLKITGTEAYAAILAGTVLPRDIYGRLLSDLLEDIGNRDEDFGKTKKRLFLSGSVCDDFELIDLIEGSNAVVVGENVCFGVRNETDMVDESMEPVKALATKYLSGAVCPRMSGFYKERSAIILDRIKSGKADGVILQNIRFCDFHSTENGLFEREVEKHGIPALRIEREHGSLVDSGRLKMRIDAFIEQLASRKNNLRSTNLNQG